MTAPHPPPKEVPPKLSVLMPMCNAGRFLDAAITSIRNQTVVEWELLVCDDGSTDDSRERLSKWLEVDYRIRLIPLPGVVGIASALNILAEHARADLLARMDADDTCDPHRFARQLEFLNTHPNYVAVSTGTLCVDPEGRPIKHLSYCDRPEDLLSNLLNRDGPGVCHAAAMFRKAVFFEAGCYRDKFRHVEDIDLWLRMLPHGKIGVVPEILYHYRMHIQSVCHRRAAEQRRLRLVLTEETIRDRREKGLPVPAAVSHSALPPSVSGEEATSQEIFRNWAHNATLAGYRQTAIHWAFHLWRRDKLNRAHWWLMLDALVGLRISALLKKAYVAGKRSTVRPPTPASR